MPRSFREPVAKRFFGGCILQGELRKYLLGRLFHFFEVFGQCEKRVVAASAALFGLLLNRGRESQWRE